MPLPDLQRWGAERVQRGGQAPSPPRWPHPKTKQRHRGRSASAHEYSRARCILVVHRTSIKLLSVQKARGAVLVLSREFCSLCIDPVHREAVQLGVKVAIEQQGVTMCVSEAHRWSLSFILGGSRPPFKGRQMQQGG